VKHRLRDRPHSRISGRFRAGVMLGVVLALALVMGGCAGRKAEPAGASQGTQPQQQGSQPQVNGVTPAQGTEATAVQTFRIVASESQASYSVKEKFFSQDLNVTAVGKTSDLAGELVLTNGVLKPSKVTVDLRTLKSDKERRDAVLRSRGLESDKYPYAEFQITGMEGASLIEGQEVTFKLTGNLKLHGTEKPVTWQAKALLQGGTLKLHATITFNMTEFGIDPPNVLNFVSVDENVTLDVQITARS
jgi:polyisoprenoid-binding protein YceI